MKEVRDKQSKALLFFPEPHELENKRKFNSLEKENNELKARLLKIEKMIGEK